ncbi:hypothetical protein EV121DRAFT_297359 [Schizophyllum commune]
MYSSVITNSTPSLRRVSSNPVLKAVDRLLDGPGDAYLLVLAAGEVSNNPRRAYMRTHPYLVNYANESGQIEYTELGRPTIRVNLTKAELDDYFEAVKLKTNTLRYFACPTAPAADAPISSNFPLPFENAVNIACAARLFGDRVVMHQAASHIEAYIPIPRRWNERSRAIADIPRSPATAANLSVALRLARFIEESGFVWLKPGALELLSRLGDLFDIFSPLPSASSDFDVVSLPQSFKDILSQNSDAAVPFRTAYATERFALHLEKAHYTPSKACTRPAICAPLRSAFRDRLEKGSPLLTGALEPLSLETVAFFGDCEVCRQELLDVDSRWAKAYYLRLPEAYGYEPDWTAMCNMRADAGLV